MEQNQDIAQGAFGDADISSSDVSDKEHDAPREASAPSVKWMLTDDVFNPYLLEAPTEIAQAVDEENGVALSVKMKSRPEICFHGAMYSHASEYPKGLRDVLKRGGLP